MRHGAETEMRCNLAYISEKYVRRGAWSPIPKIRDTAINSSAETKSKSTGRTI